MTKPPTKSPASRALEAAAKPVEAAAHAVLDPLASVIKRGLRRPGTEAATPEPEAAPTPGKPGLKVSPLAVSMPKMAPIAGVQMGIGRAGFYKHERPDLLVMRFAPGTSCAGVFTRHGVGSAPVDWCKKQLESSGGEGVQALVVNAGCANSFTGKPGADAVRRVAGAVAKRFDCRQRDVMMASTGVIGVLLDDGKITQKLPTIEGLLTDDAWQDAAKAIMTTDTFPKGAFAQARIGGKKVRVAGMAKGSGMIAPAMATMLAYVFTDAAV